VALHIKQETKVQKLTKSFQFGEHTVTLETGEIARQASATVMVSMADTVVMVAVVGRKEAKAWPVFLSFDGKLPGKILRRRAYPGWILQT